MAHKTLLLSLNEIHRVPHLIDAARTLATAWGAHVSGLYVVPAVQVYPAAGYAATPDVYDGNRKHFETHLPKVQASFESAMKADGISFDFRSLEASAPLIGNEVMVQGRNCDLIIVSATDRDASTGVEYDFVERLVIAAGRPVLVLPARGNVKLQLDEMIIAWDGSREAARATFDAMPLLRLAKNVRIVGIDTSARGELQGATLAEAIHRHGVKCELTNVTSDGYSAGETLLRAANDHGAGLIVLGAYGHNRFSEFIFGGVTRHMVRHLDRPILMSH